MTILLLSRDAVTICSIKLLSQRVKTVLASSDKCTGSLSQVVQLSAAEMPPKVWHEPERHLSVCSVSPVLMMNSIPVLREWTGIYETDMTIEFGGGREEERERERVRV